MTDRRVKSGNHLISCGLGVAGLLGILLLSGCRSTPQEPPPPPASQWFDTGSFRVELVDASLPRDVRSTGCRFLLGGWVRSLIPQGTGASVLRSRSIHHRLPAYGCPFEFYPTLELEAGELPGHSTRLQIGVGVVREHGEGRFETIPVEFFPWQTSVEHTGDATRLVYRQNSSDRAGYAYELTVTLTLKRGSDTVGYEITLANTGRRRIETELYAHPFFDVAPEFDAGWFRLPGGAQESIAAAPESVESTRSGTGIAAGNFSPLCGSVTLRCSPAMDRAVFWKHPKNFFSLEPFRRFSVAPGERQSWRCLLTVSR